MTNTTSEAFLSGQGIIVAPSKIEAELTRLWGPAAEEAQGSDLDNQAVTRIVLANLVIAADNTSAARVVDSLDEVVVRYPSRAIVMGLTEAPAREIQAEIAALCHLPAPGMPQICSERILLSAGPQALDLLPGAVRPLLEADLPVVLWWTADPRKTEALFRDLADESTRIILDLPDQETSVEALKLGLDASLNKYSRDASWFGISRWRELVAQFFDGPSGHQTIAKINSVEIEVIAPEAGALPRASVWLAAWLAGQLGWTPVSRKATSGRIDAIFDANGQKITLSILTQVDPTASKTHLHAVTIETSDIAGSLSYRLARPKTKPNELRVEICCDHTCALPRVVVAPDLDAPRRIAAALESSREDPPFRRALPHLFWLLTD
jgi:glucose-6-phosphate dehydrogenase assembly protein OpcA